jgi:hypothetical protein
MFERLPYRVMALHGGVIVGGDVYIQMTFNSAPLTSHDTMWVAKGAMRHLIAPP